MTTFRGEDSLPAWLNRHHVDVIRTQATKLDGTLIGEYVHRNKFLAALPNGSIVNDVALALDDVCLKPDLDTLTPDRHDSNLGHCIANVVTTDGAEIGNCPRTTLSRVVKQLHTMGYAANISPQLEFYLYQVSFPEAQSRKYKDLPPLGLSRPPYALRDSYHAKGFMDETTHRMAYLGIEWESWNAANGIGQLTLKLTPTDPITTADRILRTKQIIYEVATDQDIAATFMSAPTTDRSSDLYIDHSLTRADAEVLDEDTVTHWLGGLLTTLPASIAYLCPTINAYRRQTPFSLDAIRRRRGSSNGLIHRLGSSDLNPYLGIAVILAGGIVGLKNQVNPDDSLGVPGLPIPDSLDAAITNLEQSEELASVLGKDIVTHWADAHRMSIVPNASDQDNISDWEYHRYFEFI